MRSAAVQPVAANMDASLPRHEHAAPQWLDDMELCYGSSQQRTIAHWAAWAGDLSVLKGLPLKDLRIQASDESSPVLLAAMMGHAQVVRWLCQISPAVAQVATSSDRWTAGHFASAFGHLEVLHYLGEFSPETLAAADHKGRTATHFASTYQVMKVLVDHVPQTIIEKDVEGETPGHRAARAGYVGVVQCLVDCAPADALLVQDDVEGATPAHYACQSGHVNVVQCLSNQGGYLTTSDHYGATPAHYACEAGHIDVVRSLQAFDDSLMRKQDAEGLTPAHSAAQAGQTGVIRHLVETDPACLIIQDSIGQSPAHLAALSGRASVIQCLGELMPSTLHATEENGGTPAHYAAWDNQLAVVRCLFEFARATLQIKDDRGDIPVGLVQDSNGTIAQFLRCCTDWTPLMAAVVLRRPSIVAQLLHIGADPTAIVVHEKREITAFDLAINSAQDRWSLEICPQTVQLVTRSLKWSPYQLKWHKLFPPQFRHGVRHVCGLKVALDAADRRLPNPLWLMIISFLPRGWQFQRD